MTYEKQIVGVKKPVRSKAGVTVLTVVLKSKKCEHGTCLYCPGGDDVPQSYTNKSPPGQYKHVPCSHFLDFRTTVNTVTPALLLTGFFTPTICFSYVMII